MKIKRAYLILILLGLSNLVRGQEDLKIGLKNDDQREKHFKEKLLRVLEEYDVQKWIFTDTLVIANNEIPHSHPVLTLNTRPQSDLSLLSTFIHENVHWFLVKNKDIANIAINQLREKFENVPVGKGQGAKSEYSTYLHLLVNYLEYDAIKKLAGQKAALIVISRKKYYKWIYRTVLENEKYFKKMIKENKLKI